MSQKYHDSGFSNTPEIQIQPSDALTTMIQVYHLKGIAE